MNANGVARRYHQLTPEERFRLILAAGGRGDEAERDRLANSAGRIALSMSDHWPYASAFEDLATQVFLELLEDAGAYFDAFRSALNALDLFGEDEEGEDGDEEADARLSEDDDGEQSEAEREMDVALGFGFVFKAKVEGWNLFCERLTIPPLLLWEHLPGFNRFQSILKLTETHAFNSEGFCVWMNRRRPDGPRLRRAPFTAEGFAASAGRLFRKAFAYWGGDSPPGGAW